jgi:hypothetical protein
MVLSSQQIAKFHEDGYVVFDTTIPEATLDTAAQTFLGYWGHDTPKPDFVPYADFNRIQDGWKICAEVKTIATYPVVMQALQQLYQREAKPFQTLNFYKGTEQPAHVDYIHFNSEPFGLMCGVWVALEDIGLDQGPLVYYPKSNLLPEINFEEAGLAPDYDNYFLYLKYLMAQAEQAGLTEEYGILKKGQALIWSANLIHGGALQKNKSLTRQSQVTHYFFEGARAWRPGHTNNEGRTYFQPDWLIPELAKVKQAQPNLFATIKSWFKAK